MPGSQILASLQQGSASRVGVGVRPLVLLRATRRLALDRDGVRIHGPLRHRAARAATHIKEDSRFQDDGDVPRSTPRACAKFGIVVALGRGLGHG